MITITALTSGKETPSSRYRVRQHIPALRRMGVAVQEYCPSIEKYAPVPFWPAEKSPKHILPVYFAWQAIKLMTRLPGLTASHKNDAVWLERQILPGYLTIESVIKKPVIFDVDDSIWLARPFGKSAVRRTAELSEVVIAGNQFIACWFERYNKKIVIIPTAVDTSRYCPPPANPAKSDKFIIGWIGTRGNLPYLEGIEEPISSFLKQFPNAELLVISDALPSFRQIPEDRLRYSKWSAETEVALIQSINVGLMPLPDNQWTRGKCSYKMLQYMSCGIPVIVSPVGMNIEVLSKGNFGFAASNKEDWLQGLMDLYQNRSYADSMGRSAREVVLLNYSHSLIADKLASVLRSAV